MPRSKRNRPISLTAVKKKTKETKTSLVENVRAAVAKYQHCYVICLNNQRNASLKVLREKLQPGRIFYGKNKVMQVALGTKPENETQENTHKLAKHLTGERGLLFSDAALSEVQEVLESFQPEEFARAGFVAERTVTVQAGSEGLAGMAHSLEPQLRQLGMPTVLRDGRIHLLGEFTACTAGKPLTSSQAQILKHLGIRCSKFVVGLDAVWTQGGNFLRLAA
eukprot:GHVT01056048.1.p1 GENE.GHVT01056048.1~~GHVT01056048.1.p1  ORF type:complete len:222 (+),score=46.33 GHVT01056048.1:49-714(+)